MTDEAAAERERLAAAFLLEHGSAVLQALWFCNEKNAGPYRRALLAFEPVLHSYPLSKDCRLCDGECYRTNGHENTVRCSRCRGTGKEPEPSVANDGAGPCAIASQTIGACDLEWGHAGDIHSNAGDGFYALPFDDEHHRRQTAARKT